MVTLIVDDDGVSRTILEDYVRHTPGLLNLASCASSGEASEVLSREEVHLLLLDVEMPVLSGLEMLSTLKHRPHVIVVSGSERHAVAAFEDDVADYLLKPVAYPRFLKAVQRVRAARLASPDGGRAPASNPHIFLKTGQRLVKVDLREIDRFEARRDYVLVCMGSRTLLVHSTMSSVEDFLSKSDFVRVHRSHIVRIDRITDIETGSLVVGGTVIPISPSYRSALGYHIRQL
jgi:two-component system, LytTR family, response regulator